MAYLASDASGRLESPARGSLARWRQTRHAWSRAGTAGRPGTPVAYDGQFSVRLIGRRTASTPKTPGGPHSSSLSLIDNPRPVLVGPVDGCEVRSPAWSAVGENRVKAPQQPSVLVDIAPHIEPEGADKIRAFMDQNQDTQNRSGRRHHQCPAVAGAPPCVSLTDWLRTFRLAMTVYQLALGPANEVPAEPTTEA